jgi:large subunit ribosomal protein L29
MQRARDLRLLPEEDLKKKESDLREDLFNLRFQQKVGQLENPLKLRIVRKDIARVMTLQGEKKREKIQKAAEAK